MTLATWFLYCLLKSYIVPLSREQIWRQLEVLPDAVTQYTQYSVLWNKTLTAQPRELPSLVVIGHCVGRNIFIDFRLRSTVLGFILDGKHLDSTDHRGTINSPVALMRSDFHLAVWMVTLL